MMLFQWEGLRANEDEWAAQTHFADVPGGVLVRVTEHQRMEPIRPASQAPWVPSAVALQFVPGCRIVREVDADRSPARQEGRLVLQTAI